MKKKRFSEEQIIKILKRHEAGEKAQDLCREFGVHETTFYNWRKEYNEENPHSSLGYLTPKEFANKEGLVLTA